MTGFIVRNEYLYTEKFSAHVEAFEKAFRGAGAEIFTFSNADFSISIENGIKIAPKQAKIAQKTAEKPHFILFWDKDIALAKCFEAYGLRLFNSSDCIATCDSKSLTHAALAAKSIPSPLTTFAPFTYSNIGCDSGFVAAYVEDVLSYPVVAKADKGSFGQQIFLANDRKELISAIKSGAGLFQKYVEGKDLRVNVMGDRAVSAVSRSNEGDFRKNAAIGGSMKKYPLDRELSEIAVAAARAVGADFCGVDVLKCADGYKVIEVNSNAHFLNALEATGDNMAEHIARYILDIVNFGARTK